METELLTSQLTAAYAASALLEWLKKQSWFPFANANTAALNRATSIIFAFFAAAGLHYTFDSEAGVLTISGLTAVNIAHAIWAWIQQYAFQQAAYRGLVKNGGSQ